MRSGMLKIISSSFTPMETIFTLSDSVDEKLKINLDDLYERKKQQDLNTLALYNRILARVHVRIKTVSRQQKQEQFCWYVVPEMIIGIPKYDNAACIAYMIDQLRDNGFAVKYTHPNLLLISWADWCPAYVRAEIKKKTGVVVDGYGQPVEPDEDDDPSKSSDPNALMLYKNGAGAGASKDKDKDKLYKPINTYKPTGLIYNQSLLKTIEEKTKVVQT